jgi:hypothetical protein
MFQASYNESQAQLKGFEPRLVTIQMTQDNGKATSMTAQRFLEREKESGGQRDNIQQQMTDPCHSLGCQVPRRLGSGLTLCYP